VCLCVSENLVHTSSVDEMEIPGQLLGNRRSVPLSPSSSPPFSSSPFPSSFSPSSSITTSASSILRENCIVAYQTVSVRDTLTLEGVSLLLQWVAVCCSGLQCVTVGCSVFWHTKLCRYATHSHLKESHFIAVCCSVLQCVAVCCSVLHYVLAYQNVSVRDTLTLEGVSF